MRCHSPPGVRRSALCRRSGLAWLTGRVSRLFHPLVLLQAQCFPPLSPLAITCLPGRNPRYLPFRPCCVAIRWQATGHRAGQSDYITKQVHAHQASVGSWAWTSGQCAGLGQVASLLCQCATVRVCPPGGIPPREEGWRSAECRFRVLELGLDKRNKVW